jgi:O-antigen/teichoic acid export membrane protein
MLLMTRFKLFKNQAISKVVEAVTGGGISVLLGWVLGPVAGGLLGGMALGLICTIAAMCHFKRDSIKIADALRMNKNELLRYAKNYKDFPKLNSWSILLNVVTSNLIIIFFSILFTPAMVGFYGICKRVLQMPVRYIGDSFRRVYYQKVSLQYHQGKSLAESMKKATLGLAAVGIIPFSVIFLFGPSLFVFFFGSEWEKAGVFARIMAPGLFFAFINFPGAVMYHVLMQLRARLIYMTVFSAFRALSILVGYYLYKRPEACLSLFSATLIFFNIYYISQAYFFAVKSDNGLIRTPNTETSY